MTEYMNREVLLKNLNRFAQDNYCVTINDVIINLPAADVVEVVHGSWIPLRESEITGWNPGFAGHDPIGRYKCSKCNKEAVFDCNDSFVLSDYCPNCGTKMDGGKEGAD